MEKKMSEENIVTNDYVKEMPEIVEEIQETSSEVEESPEIESQEEPEVQENEAPEEELEEEEGEDELIPKKELSKRVGSAVSHVRKKKDAQIAQLQQEIAQLRGAQPGYQSHAESASYDGVIQDPLTGRYHAVESPEGKIILREQQIVEHQKQIEFLKKRESFESTMESAKARSETFGQHYEVVNDLATTVMGSAIMESDMPVTLINYLGKNPQEIERISKLSPKAQEKEIFKLEGLLAPKRKLTTKAPAVSKPSQPMRSVQPTGDNAIAHRKAQLREIYFGGFKT
jgi:hypothetical protein